MCNVHFQCVAFFILLIWIKPWALLNAFTIITVKKLFQALWSCSIMFFVLIYVKEWKNIKVQHNIQLSRLCAHVAFLKLIKFNLLFYFASSDQSEMVEWLKSKSLTKYHVYSKWETITNIFLENVQHKSVTCY